MNLNPFVFSYKCYPNSKLATMVNRFCGAMQRMFIVFGIGITFVAIFGDVSNWGEALCGAVLMFILWFLLKVNKDKWSDKISAKQESIDNPNLIEEK